MRELINIIENLSFLTEKSRGLLYRAKGDRFFKGNRENPESVLIFDKVEYYPSMPGSYDTSDEMLEVFNKLNKKYNITPVNSVTSPTKAFAIIILLDEKTGKPVVFARFFNAILPDMAGKWANSEMNKFGYQLEKETSLIASYGLKPTDIFVGQPRFNNASSLLNAFKQSKASQPFVPGFEMLYLPKPKLPVFEGANEFFTAIRDDLGEIIGPVALVQGLNVGTGAIAADRDLLQNAGYSGSSISFPKGKINGLVDSYIVTPSGVEIGISSKGEKGATASIKNVADGIANIRSDKGSPEQKKLLKEYSNEVILIERIGKDTAINFPLNYAIENNMLSNSGSNAIRQLIKVGAKNLDQIDIDENTAVELSNLIGYKGAKTQLQNYNIGYHALSAIAELVAGKINDDPKFGAACLKFLNSSPIIQLHMQASKQKDGDVAVTGFTSKYPPNFNGTVTLDSSKNYSATSAGGRMTFAYDGKDADEEGAGDGPIMPDVSDVAADITNPKSSSKKEKPTFDVGRKKR
jgi:hypothetical protein